MATDRRSLRVIGPLEAEARAHFQAGLDRRSLRDRRQLHEPWDPHTTDTRPLAVFREFGRFRWLVVPLAALAFALLVFAVGCLGGAAS